MGLEAAVTVTNPDDCPVATASATADGTVGAVARSSSREDAVIEEFEMANGADPPPDTREVFDGDDYSVYRFERNADRACPCERIETFGCPVADISAVDGRLRVLFRPESIETVRDVVETLRERYDEVTLEHLVRSGTATGSEAVAVDRGRLTARQREVLETAYGMGYFEHPKGANASEVAAALGISSATFRGHLAAAQSKLLDEILDG